MSEQDNALPLLPPPTSKDQHSQELVTLAFAYSNTQGIQDFDFGAFDESGGRQLTGWSC
jgi:hypothetical protein